MRKTTKRPAINPENRENQLIALAYDEAEKQMKAGKASSQIITHFLKLGSIKAETELEKLRAETEYAKAKTEGVKAQKDSTELAAKAIEAFRMYAGIKQEEGED